MSMSVLTPMPEPARRFEVFTGAGRRRTWSAEEKAAIVAESHTSGESVCSVARRHGLTPSQLFTWRRQARRALMPPEASPITFVPAIVEAPSEPPSGAMARRSRRPRPVGGIELEIAGVVIRIGAGAGEPQITAVIRAVKAAM